MKCSYCPLYFESRGENNGEQSCGLFGDDWENKLQYSDKHGVVGCYVQRWFIEKYAKEKGI